MRKVEKLINGEWAKVEWPAIKRGDVLRLFEPDGTLVVSTSGKARFVTKCDAYLNSDNIWQVSFA